MLIPEDCIKFDVCKFANDSACFDGCDFRIERPGTPCSKCGEPVGDVFCGECYDSEIND